MFINYYKFEDLDKELDRLPGREYSPGWISRIYGVSRQTVHNWINRDVIDCHRLKIGKGSYLYVKESEFAKLDAYLPTRKRLGK